MRLQVAGGGVVSIRESTAAGMQGPDLTVERGLAFIGGFTQAAVAAEFALIMLENPAASGVVVLVDRISVTTGGVSGIRGVHGVTTVPTAITNVTNKRIGGAAPVADMGQASNGATTGLQFFVATLNINRPKAYHFTPPIRLDEGENIGFWTSSANISLSLSYEWREI